MRNHLELGNWNSLCDKCGFKFKASDLKKQWDGLIVCKDDYETRHAQDFLRVQREKIAVPFSRPYPEEDTYTGYICSVVEINPRADIATADCARAGLENLPYETTGSESLWIYADREVAIAYIAIAGLAVAGKPYSLSPGT